MAEFQQLQERIDALERCVRLLREGSHSSAAKLDVYRGLIASGHRLGVSLLALLFLWLSAHYAMEYLRIRASGSAPRVAEVVPSPALQTSQSTPTASPATEPSGRSAERTRDAKRVLDDYIERAAANNKRENRSGNTYQFSLDGMRDVLKSLEDTKQIALGTAQDLLGAFANVALETGGAITKDAAKALIDRYLAPQPEAKSATGALPHQVQVNVYANEKRIVSNPPNRPAAPSPKPKTPCPPLSTPSAPTACQAPPAQQVTLGLPAA